MATLAKDIVKHYIDSALKSEVLEDSFMSLTLPINDESHKEGGSSYPGTKRLIMSLSNSNEPDKIIKHYVNLMAQVKSTSKFDRLFDVLRLAVQQRPSLGKAICEALLECERLDYYNRNSWMRSFGLITEILPHVDYKGVRDILKQVLRIIYSLPERFDVSIIPQLDTLYNTFSLILDREACLLPAYLSLDELQKRIAQGNAPVWKFAELFYHFIESFRPAAQIFSIINRPSLLPVVGYSTCQGNTSWVLDPISAKFQLKGLLPYRDRLKEPQVGQVRYLLEQSYSRDMIFTTLSLGPKSDRQIRCSELIEQIAVTLFNIMESTEQDLETYTTLSPQKSEHLFQWIHLSQHIFSYLFHNQPTISFNQLVESLCSKIRAKNMRKGGDFLMWALMQYMTGLPKGSLSDLLPVSNLFDLLYPGRLSLPLPPEDSPYFPISMAAASIWLILVKRASLDQAKILKPLPPSLRSHYEYLTNLNRPDETVTNPSYREVVYLNAYDTNKSNYPCANFIDSLCKLDAKNNINPMSAKPLSMTLLDTLTTRSKVTLLHVLIQRIAAISHESSDDQSNYLLTPALIDTYARLLVYTDIESFGMKALINHLIGGLQVKFSQNHKAWDVNHALLEMFSYRINHLTIQYKYQMLITLHNLSPMVYGENQLQLYMTLEAAELRLLLGLSNYEALNMPINPRHANDTKAAKNMINSDSEELNKVLVLVLARSLHLTSSESVNAPYLKEILADIHSITPLSWSSSTLSFFPTVIKDFFLQHPQDSVDKVRLRAIVEDEYMKWTAMTDEDALFQTFTTTTKAPVFICILWRILTNTDSLNPVVYRILESFRIRTLYAHLRTFVDYLVHEFSTSGASHISRNSETLNKLVWRHQIISLDRLLLCMCLRSFDGCEAQVCFFIIQILLLKSDFKPAVQAFCKMQTNDHSTETNCQSINSRFSAKHPEKYYHNHLRENNIENNSHVRPSFFGNICLRFLPVFDIIIHRALELRILSPNSPMKIEQIIDSYGCLYRFHNKPITYLYNTLYYYDSQLPAVLKKKLTLTIVGAFNETRPQNWFLSDHMVQYLWKNANNPITEEWTPGLDYYRKVMSRLVDTLQNKNGYYHTDWRFNEFPNVKAHAVYATAIEFMTLPVPANLVGNAILDLVLTSYVNQDRSTMAQWMNAIGLIMTALPPSYYSVLNTKILEYMKSPLLTSSLYTKDILHLMNYCDSHEWMYESQISYLVALTHSIWHHSSTGLIFNLPTFWRMEVKHAVETESQFLFVCCLIGPFLSRLERSRVMMDVVVDLYEMLGKVDSTSEIQHLNTISDFFYHIKYMFTGDAIKNDIERCIRNFKPRLQYCLRFIAPPSTVYETHARHD